MRTQLGYWSCNSWSIDFYYMVVCYFKKKNMVVCKVRVLCTVPGLWAYFGLNWGSRTVRVNSGNLI
jgi:hypothetical protein